MYLEGRQHIMEDYFRQFLGSEVLSIQQPDDKWSMLFVFQLLKNGVRNSFTLVGGPLGTTCTFPLFEEEVPDEATNLLSNADEDGSHEAALSLSDLNLSLSDEKVLHDDFLKSSSITNNVKVESQAPGSTILLLEEFEAEQVRGFIQGGRCYWSAVVRIIVTVIAGPRKLVVGESHSEVCIGLWPLQHPYMNSLNISLHMQFMSEYLNLLEDLQISAIEYATPGQLFIRVLRSNCIWTVSEELLVLNMDHTRICACIYEEERCYVDLANLVDFLIKGCNAGELFVESFKTMKLEGTHGRCPGQIVCLCDPLPRLWKASVEITLKWGNREVKIGQIPSCRKTFICDIRGSGLWPETVPFFHGVV